MIKREKINKGEKVMSLSDKKVWLNGSDYIELDSVGSTLTSELMVFPQVVNEPPETASEAEEMCGVHIYDCDDEWYTSLSAEDLTDFFEFVELNTHEIIEGPFSVWKTKLWGKWEEVNNCYMNLEAV
tara:strand:- start:1098 stop:1478 length:381 start_codon:yes stop_codon:yes gene_type:complete